ncbi:MAG: uroporphyrinogen decarboxylase [Crocinitomicaceae bacterium]|nr:uroporphyrinogen decarboxylase [Crocinitomicaceae bacterium]MBK8925538.1 uroporphyrinogen decarboxylase [Crocinitomicaceae bacterium]
MSYQNDILLRMIKGEKTSRFPVWMMRQAGRILPEYRAVRNGLKDFKELVETPERAAEVTIQPVDILGVDAAIIFSDILVVPEAMGLTYQMLENKGPWFEQTIRSEEDLKLISSSIDVHDRLGYVSEAIKITVKELDGRVPLIGFAGAPWTIFCYMVEGEGSKTFSKSKKVMFTQPQLAHQMLQMITDVTIKYLKMQIEAGAAVVQLFDSWAGILGPAEYSEFGTKYVKQICEAITEVPVTVFAKGAYYARAEFAKLKCSTIGLDWNMDVEESRKIIGAEKTLQGNLDPCVLYADFKVIETKTKNLLNSFGNQRHIANLGHGVYPDTNPEKVKCFIETVKGFAIN